MPKPEMQLFGDKALTRLFEGLGERVQRRVLRSAVTAASTPVNRAAKARAPKQSGLLKKSLGRKVVTNTKTQTVTAVIGPRTNIVGEFKGKKRKPSRYAHAVEKGFVDAAGNFVPPKPFLNPAMAATEAQAVGVLQDKLAAGVEREAKKGAGK